MDVATQSSLDRARIYRGLAHIFQVPDDGLLEDLRLHELPELRAALRRLGVDPKLQEAAQELVASLGAGRSESLERSYHETFDASGGLLCPPNEASHVADSPSRELTRTYDLADVAGFYRAFGVEVVPGSERPDHITAELEFMHLLAVKEMLAQGEDDGAEHAAICRDAARAFLRDHLGRWTDRFAARLEETGADPAYVAAGRVLDRFVALDTARLGAS